MWPPRIGLPRVPAHRYNNMKYPSFGEFLVRVAVLLAVLATLAFFDWLRHRQSATRWREYVSLMACGFAGGIFGICVDAFTATASPEYFWLGKNVPDDDRFWPRVFALGFQAGFFAGAIIGGLLLLANSANRQLPSLPMTRLFRYVPWIVVAAVSGATAAGLWLPNWDPLKLQEQLSRTLTTDELRRFMSVWAIHLGLYCGGGTGTVFSFALIWRARKLRPAP